ncbi:TlpA disulfide reductase family protein [Pseudoalteromonas sp. R3]|uniref:TlpA family protein disulfide reductase n=1 Tax=Pseudoalteromonas sp. R3 TaxID=1709477 RepID=UPI0006B4B350|nr:TlpA disulfide reductase family protein [Pseudoalteromonas sp. R3]AZZ97621.1 TlpA family protein disulfide reductase [Pseudoalteromonas sp. R3]
MIKTVLQLIIFAIVFLAVTAYQELGMLADDGKAPAPYFALPLLEQPTQRATIKSLQGQQSVVYFFAPWCSICRYSMPNLNKLHEAGKVNAVAIALDFENTDAVSAFVEDLSLSMPVLLGNSSTASDYKIKAYPTYYVLSDDLKVVERSVGYSSELGIRARL